MIHLRVNTSFKSHFILSLILGFWLVFFLVLIAPFDTADLSFKLRVLLMPPYGLILITSYLLSFLLQRLLLKWYAQWNVFLEFLIITFVYCTTVVGAFSYYKTDAVNGTYSFFEYLTVVYLPILLIVTTLLLFGRWFIARPKEIKKKKVVVRGESKSDVLQVLEEDILCASSAQNYVELHYLSNGNRHTQVLRSTLKKVHQELPHLVQIHRSHLVNPDHFIQWKGAQHILVGDLEVPVSKNYKDTVNSFI